MKPFDPVVDGCSAWLHYWQGKWKKLHWACKIESPLLCWLVRQTTTRNLKPGRSFSFNWIANVTNDQPPGNTQAPSQSVPAVIHPPLEQWETIELGLWLLLANSRLFAVQFYFQWRIEQSSNQPTVKTCGWWHNHSPDFSRKSVFNLKPISSLRYSPRKEKVEVLFLFNKWQDSSQSSHDTCLDCHEWYNYSLINNNSFFNTKRQPPPGWGYGEDNRAIITASW